jgi:hypothetical protein
VGQAIGSALPLAVGVALSPLPIIAVVLVLTTHRARVNGPLFILGWLAGLAVVGAIVLSVAGPAGHNAVIMPVLCLVIGAKLIGDAISGLAA